MKTKYKLLIAGSLILSIVTGKKNKVWHKETQKKIDLLHPLIRTDVINFINDAEKKGIFLIITSGLRTFDEQSKLYEQGRTKSGRIITNAKAGESFHNYGIAFDVVPIIDNKPNYNNADWSKIASVGKSFGFEWGGDWVTFKDKPHFQKTFGKTINFFKKNYKKNQAYVSIN